MRSRHVPKRFEPEDHTILWTADWMDYLLSEMKPREKTLNLKLCRAGAHKLTENLREVYDHARAVCGLFGTDSPQGIEDLKAAVKNLREVIHRGKLVDDTEG